MPSEISTYFDVDYINLPTVLNGLVEWKNYNKYFGGKNVFGKERELNKLVDKDFLQEIFNNNGCVYIKMDVDREEVVYVKHRALPRFVSLTKEGAISKSYNVSVSKEAYYDYKRMIVDYFKEGRLFVKVKI